MAVQGRKGGSHVGAQSVSAFEQCIELYLEINIALGEDDRALLKRLLDDDRVGEKYGAQSERMQSSTDGPIGVDAPMDFIITILQLKSAAEKRARQISRLQRWWPRQRKCRLKLQEDWAAKLRRVPFQERGKILRTTEKYIAGMSFSFDISLPRVRSDRDGSRARTYFMRDLSALVHDLTDKRLDEQVALITEIAFNARRNHQQRHRPQGSLTKKAAALITGTLVFDFASECAAADPPTWIKRGHRNEPQVTYMVHELVLEPECRALTRLHPSTRQRLEKRGQFPKSPSRSAIPLPSTAARLGLALRS